MGNMLNFMTFLFIAKTSCSLPIKNGDTNMEIALLCQKQRYKNLNKCYDVWFGLYVCAKFCLLIYNHSMIFKTRFL